MQIKTIQIENYKSFFESNVIAFEHGINLVVGQNNSGKTALLEAASFRLKHKPNRGFSETKRNPPGSFAASVVSVVAEITGAEFYSALMAGDQFYIPVKSLPKEKASRLPSSVVLPELKKVVDLLREKSSIEFSFKFSIGIGPKQILQVEGPRWLYEENKESAFFFISFDQNQERIGVSSSLMHDADMRKFGWTSLANNLVSSIYFFEAERINLGICDFGEEDVLKPNAENLAQVINRLQGKNPHLYNLLNEYMKKIFPSISWISAISKTIKHDALGFGDTSQHVLELTVWPNNGYPDREDLSIPMSECGTGVGHVLAILYVVITTKDPQIIVIDEPNSFLHPGASRKLVEILRKDFSKHQYILSTHSPEIIRGSGAKTVNLVKWQKTGSTVTQFTETYMQMFQSILGEIGVKMSDLFGADSILWVEGPTEEICMQEMLSEIFTLPPSVISVANTGDFESKKISLERLLGVYEKISQNNALIPPNIAFIFDSEERKQRELDDLSRRGKGKLHFLPRRMLENYFLDSEAINAVLSANTDYEGTAKVVQLFITENKLSEDILPKNSDVKDMSDEDWIKVVNGAKLLQKIFFHFLGSKVEFSKTKHSVEICRWLLKNKPVALADLRGFVKNIAETQLYVN